MALLGARCRVHGARYMGHIVKMDSKDAKFCVSIQIDEN
jgi:hypothetical protein